MTTPLIESIDQKPLDTSHSEALDELLGILFSQIKELKEKIQTLEKDVKNLSQQIELKS